MDHLRELITQPIIQLGLTLIIGYIIGILVYYILRKAMHRTLSLDTTRIDKRFKRPFNLFFAVLISYAVCHWLDFRVELGETLQKTLFIAMVMTLCWLLFAGVNVASLIIENKFTIDTKDNLMHRKVQTQFSYIRKISKLIIFIIGFSLVLLSFQEVRKVGVSILASAGLAGVIIGFAAQKTLTNLLAGFQIAFTQPLRLDDVLIVENEYGRVEEITLTYVVLKIWDDRRLVVPLSYFIEKPFQNWTRVHSQLLGSVYLHVDYSVPIDELRTHLKDIVENHELYDGRVVNLAVTDANESNLRIRALISANDSSSAWDLRCFVREEMIKFLQKNYPESLPKQRITFSPATDQDSSALSNPNPSEVQ